MKDKTFKKNDKYSQTYKCLRCDAKDSVKWDGEKWVCEQCKFQYMIPLAGELSN